MSHERVRTLLHEAENYIALYQRNLNDGKTIDMSGFEKLATDFCNELSDMSREDAKLYEKSLNSLGISLQDLSEALVSRRDSIKTQINELNAASKASTAYNNNANAGNK